MTYDSLAFVAAQRPADHFRSWWSFVTRKMPRPCAAFAGFMIHVARGHRRNSSTKSE